MASQTVEGRCVMSVWCQLPRRRPFATSVNLPFTLFTFRSLSTQARCLLATGVLGRKHRLCYYNVGACRHSFHLTARLPAGVFSLVLQQIVHVAVRVTAWVR